MPLQDYVLLDGSRKWNEQKLYKKSNQLSLFDRNWHEIDIDFTSKSSNKNIDSSNGMEASSMPVGIFVYFPFHTFEINRSVLTKIINAHFKNLSKFMINLVLSTGTHHSNEYTICERGTNNEKNNKQNENAFEFDDACVCVCVCECCDVVDVTVVCWFYRRTRSRSIQPFFL